MLKKTAAKLVLCGRMYSEIKSEARKEFAERLKVEISLNTRISNEDYLDIDSDIDRLLAEMEREGK